MVGRNKIYQLQILTVFSVDIKHRILSNNTINMTSLQDYINNNPFPQTQPQEGFFTKNIINPIKMLLLKASIKSVSGYMEGVNATNPLQLLDSAGKMIGGVGGAVASPLAPVLNPTLGAASGGISNALSNTPFNSRCCRKPSY